MNRKPFMRWGRFYNNSDDRIARRLSNFVKTLYIVAKHRFALRSQPKLIQSDFIAEWMVAPAITHSSVEPVITWIGHATFLIQIGGLNILTDPVFFDVSRFFKRKVRSALSIHQLPKIDIILISHNHCDHLDLPSLSFLKKDNPTILVPLGNKRWLQQRGFDTVQEMEWGQEIIINNVLVCTFLPAHHWTSRGLFDINTTLWGSWLIRDKGTKIYFAGDSAYGDHFAVIGKSFGPIDIILMPIGPNEPRHLMNESHVGIDEAIQAFDDLDGHHFIPMHWGTFRSGVDNFHDLVNLLTVAWRTYVEKKSQCALHIMKFGQSATFEHLKKGSD
ncbi:MAG: MBL fold metallo-hydrolase [Candidatus Babeliales bacterium]